MNNSTLTKFPLFLTILILCFFRPLSLPAQNNYLIKHYTNENGLPANGIRGIELDKKNGFLWVGTQAGLVRFDGRHFTNFAASKDAVSSSRVALIARNREGTIFSADEHFSVDRIDSNQAVFAITDTFFIHPYRAGPSELHAWPAEKIAEKVRTLQPSSFLPPWVLFRDEAHDSSSFSFHHLGHVYHYQARQRQLLDFPGFNMVIKLGIETYFVRSALELSWYNDSVGKLLPVHIQNVPDCNSNKKEKPRLIWMPGMDAPLIICGRDIWKLVGKKDTLRLQPICQECCPENGSITSIQTWDEQGLLFLGSEANGLYVVKTPVIRSVRPQPAIEAGKAEYAQIEASP